MKIEGDLPLRLPSQLTSVSCHTSLPTGLLIITALWTSTTLTEFFASRPAEIFVKTATPWGFLLLIPCLAAARGSGTTGKIPAESDLQSDHK
jgi:hypothetical protein